MRLYDWMLGIGLFNWTVMDILTTYIGITEYGAREANPIARAMIDEFGLLNSMFMSKTVVSVLVLMFFYVVLDSYGNSVITSVLRYYLATMIFVIGTFVAYSNLLLIL